ncbi:MAG: hypothetical protein ACJ739_03935 [Acidimicrobiales bacterium]
MRAGVSRRLTALGAGALAAASMVAVASPGQAASAIARAVPGAAAREEGFRLETSTTYRVDPTGGAVHVIHDATLTNNKPNTTSGSYYTEYFLPEYGVPVLAEAVDVRASEGGAALPVRFESTESPRVKFAVADLQPDLRYGHTQTVHLTYDLPKETPRSEAYTRLNEAYATFPVLATGDPGLATVEIVVPKGFEVEIVGDEMQRSERDGQQVYTAAHIADPDSWFANLSARDDSKLLERTVDVGDEEVDVLGWPDDAAWVDFAHEQVDEGVPVLEELIGLEWPATSTIDVVETASPYLYGYAGWYMPFASAIEVGDALDQHVMLHELAHLWFNDRLFEGRWINEALADVLAAAAIGELGGDVPTPEPIDESDPARLKLNDWSDPDLEEGGSDAQEAYGYNTSWAVMQAIADEIGMERLSDVIRAADAGEIAYRGPGVPEEVSRTFDWKELLDLFEEVGGSQKAAGLFERHVVGTDQGELFAARATARERYAALVAAGEGWTPPTSIRLAMTDWRFPDAGSLMDEALAILDAKAELLRLVADLDVSEDLALEDTYEAGKDLDDVAAAADEAVASARVLGDAEDSVAAGAGPLGALGLLFGGAGDELADAHAAFDAGDYDTARDRASDVEEVVDSAPVTALVRLLGLIVLVAAVVLARMAWTARRRRRAEAEAARPVYGPPAPAELEPSEPHGAEGIGGAVDDRGELGV